MQWEQLLSLRRQGDKHKRLRKEEDETRLGFEVDYDRIIFSLKIGFVNNGLVSNWRIFFNWKRVEIQRRTYCKAMARPLRF